MAITFITGIPRSGKSYYAMYLLYMQFIKQKSTSKLSEFQDKYFPKKHTKTYDLAYTNINQFDFSKSEKIKPYDYNELQAKLVLLHGMYLNKATDDELILNAKGMSIFNALFVIDEAQNFFSKENAVTTWWLTYHGHLHQDIILITQNLDLIEKSYFKLAEFYYKAVPPSSRFFSNKFRYIQFNSYKLFKGDRIGDFHVPMIKDIFSMYVSGAENNSKSIVKKFLMIGAVLFIIVLLLFKNFLSMFDVAPVDNNTTKADKNASIVASAPTALKDPYDLKQHKLKIDTPIKDERDNTDDVLFNIRCIDLLCNYKGIDFPKPLFNKITKKLSPDFIWFFQNSAHTEYFVMLPKETFNFLQIGEKENDKQKSNEAKKPPKATDILATSHK